MNQLPIEVQESLQPRLKVIWWGRRAIYEMAEEISEGIFRTWIILSITWWLESNFRLTEDLFNPVGYWLVAVILCLLAAHHALLEVAFWKNEIYVVCLDEQNGGGRVYKFFGWLNKKHIDEPISPASPTVTYDQPWFYRIWGKLTGEQMARISLKSMNHTFLDGQRISPQFEKAIQKIRGGKRVQDDTAPSELKNLQDIQQAVVDGLIPKDFGQEAAQQIVRRAIYGN